MSLNCLECPSGFYGPNCKGKCNATCNSFNKKSGVCENGCKPGWKGAFVKAVTFKLFKAYLQFFKTGKLIKVADL